MAIHIIVVSFSIHFECNFLFQNLLVGVDVRNPSDGDFKSVEKFLCRLYNAKEDTLNKVRMRTLLLVSKAEENPPTSNSAYYHICRSFCQAGKWIYAFVPTHANFLPSAVASGGFVSTEDGSLKPIMSTLEPVPDEVIGGVSCNCKLECLNGRCSCYSSGNKCTVLCHKAQKYRSENCRNCIDQD